MGISVVMPAYNAEKYISQALDSLVCQTYNEWECIVINDGSTDSTLQILEQYTQKDVRIKYKTIPNSGAAKIPRDIAVSMSKYEWIVALDADDYLEAESLKKLLEKANQTNAEVVVQKMIAFDQLSGKILHEIPNKDFDSNQIFSGEQAVMLTIGQWVIGANGALIKKSLWVTKQSYNTSINHMNADEYDTRDMFLRASVVAYQSASIYWFRQFAESITKRVSYRLFEPLTTQFMLIELIETHFGQNSTQAKTTKSVALRYLLSTYLKFETYRNQLSEYDKTQVIKLIKTHKKKLHFNETIKVDIPLYKKMFLLLPSNMIFLLARSINFLYVKSR